MIPSCVGSNPATPAIMIKDIQFLITGGTIDSEYDIINYTITPAKESSVKQYVEKYLRPEYGIFEQVIALVDSRDVTEQIRQELFEAVRSSKSDNIIVTHGTVTMQETAKYLIERIQNDNDPHVKNKKVVLLGSFHPLLFHPSDAPFNLGFALGVIDYVAPGVYIAMNSRLFDPHNICKDAHVRFVTSK